MPTQANPSINLNLVLDQVAKDKGIDRGVLIATLEDAMKTAAKKHFGQDRNLEAKYDAEKGVVELFQAINVVEQIVDPIQAVNQITLDEARKKGMEVEAGDELVFRMAVSGEAGKSRPAPSGKLAGATVYSYVWPTSLDSAVIGFAADQGILAFAVTSHPDFDDTPLLDENGDGDKANDGDLWHSHWVVLVPDDACGAGMLKVKDIPEGHLCCGSAGTYNIMQPDIAERLRDRKIGNIEKTAPDIIAAGNIGCIAQIGSGTTVPVLHPVELIDWATGGPVPEQLKNRVAH